MSISGGMNRPGELLLQPSAAQQRRAEPDAREQPADEDRRAEHELAGHRHPAEEGPYHPGCEDAGHADEEITVAVGRERASLRHLPAGDRLAHGMGHGERTAHDAGHEQQREDDHHEGNEEDPGDREDQPDDQHAEGRQDEDLSQETHDEGAAEGTAHGIGRDLEGRLAEEHQAEPGQHQGEEDAGGAGERPQDLAHRRRVPRRAAARPRATTWCAPRPSPHRPRAAPGRRARARHPPPPRPNAARCHHPSSRGCPRAGHRHPRCPRARAGRPSSSGRTRC